MTAAVDEVAHARAQDELTESEYQTIITQPKWSYVLACDPKTREKLLSERFPERKVNQILHRMESTWSWKKDVGTDDLVAAIRKLTVETHSKELKRIIGLRDGGPQNAVCHSIYVQNADGATDNKLLKFRFFWKESFRPVPLDECLDFNKLPSVDGRDEYVDNAQHETQALQLLGEEKARPYIHVATAREMSLIMRCDLIWMLAEQQFWLVVRQQDVGSRTLWAPENRVGELRALGVRFSVARLDDFPQDLKGLHAESWRPGRDEYNLPPTPSEVDSNSIDDTYHVAKLRVVSDKGYKAVPAIRLDGKTQACQFTYPDPPQDGYDYVFDREHEDYVSDGED